MNEFPVGKIYMLKVFFKFSIFCKFESHRYATQDQEIKHGGIILLGYATILTILLSPVFNVIQKVDRSISLS